MEGQKRGESEWEGRRKKRRITCNFLESSNERSSWQVQGKKQRDERRDPRPWILGEQPPKKKFKKKNRVFSVVS